MELYKRLLQSDILCFQNSVFPTWCLTVTLGLTRRTPILWFQLTDWPRQAKRQRYQYSLITWGAQLGCFLVPNCFVSLPFGLIFAPLGASSLFPPFAAAVVRGDSQRHSWSNLIITFGSMLIIDSLIIFSLFFGFGDFLTVKVGWDEIFWKVIVWEIWNSDSQYLSPK